MRELKRRKTSPHTSEHQRISKTPSTSATTSTTGAERHDIGPADIDWYVDLAQSGSHPGRKQFLELTDNIDGGEYDRVIVWEITRLARLGSIYQRFFETAADAGCVVNITNGWIATVRLDGIGKLIADISAAVAEEERRKLISRVNRGVKRAKKEGKWLGEVPIGFERNGDGYLRPTLTPDQGDDGYLEIRNALEAIENGSSYRYRKRKGATRQDRRSVGSNKTRSGGHGTLMPSQGTTESKRLWNRFATNDLANLSTVLVRCSHVNSRVNSQVNLRTTTRIYLCEHVLTPI